MTTIPGHNQMIQQSGAAQEISQQAHSPKPSPEQAAGIQQNQEIVENSTVLESDESDRMKEQKEQRKRREQEKEAKKRKRSKEELAVDFDTSGRLLDTTA